MRIVDLTPTQKKFQQKAREDAGVCIRYKHEHSDTVVCINQQAAWPIEAKTFYCSNHGFLPLGAPPCLCTKVNR